MAFASSPISEDCGSSPQSPSSKPIQQAPFKLRNTPDHYQHIQPRSATNASSTSYHQPEHQRGRLFVSRSSGESISTRHLPAPPPPAALRPDASETRLSYTTRHHEVLSSTVEKPTDVAVPRSPQPTPSTKSESKLSYYSVNSTESSEPDVKSHVAVPPAARERGKASSVNSKGSSSSILSFICPCIQPR